MRLRIIKRKAATSAPGLGSPLPHMQWQWDWAYPSHICTGTGLARLLSHLHWEGGPRAAAHWHATDARASKLQRNGSRGYSQRYSSTIGPPILGGTPNGTRARSAYSILLVSAADCAPPRRRRSCSILSTATSARSPSAGGRCPSTRQYPSRRGALTLVLPSTQRCDSSHDRYLDRPCTHRFPA